MITDIPDGAVVDIGGTKVMVGIVQDSEIVDVATFATGPWPSRFRRHWTEERASLPGGQPAAACEYPLAAELAGRLGGVPIVLGHDANLGLVGKAVAVAARDAAITAREVVAVAELGDGACAEIVGQAVSLLAMAIDMVQRILDPEVVVLGAGS